MSEDRRVARADGEPTKHGPAGAARWSAYLDWMRQEIIDGVLGISETERRTTRLPSGWTPIELLSHVLHMEQRWFVWGFLGEHVDEPWGDWTVDEPWDNELGGRWLVPDDVEAEELVAALWAMGERTRMVLRDHPLDTPAAENGRFRTDPPTLEWICFHVMAEYARHAGHLDIAIELGTWRRPTPPSR